MGASKNGHHLGVGKHCGEGGKAGEGHPSF